MVDDLHATHRRLAASGLDPSPIEARPAIGHEVFTVREPAGHVISVFSSHVSGEPVRAGAPPTGPRRRVRAGRWAGC